MGPGQAKSVVVTGASTGIGRATVAELVRNGFHVWATVRREEDAERLRQEHGESVTALLLDLLDHDSVREAGRTVVAAGPLYGLVNNAGASLPGPLEFLPIEVFRRQIEINLVGQLLVTQVMMPALLQGAGEFGDARIVMIGSIGGRIAGPILGAYHAAKHGLVGLADSLRAELAPFNVRVALIEPGAIATPIWERAAAAAEELQTLAPVGVERYTRQLEAARAMAKSGAAGLSPDVVARTIARVLTSAHPKPRQVIGRDAKAIALLVRLLPYRLLYRVTAGKA